MNLVQATYPRRAALEAADEVRGHTRLTFSIFIVYVVKRISSLACDAAAVIFSPPAISRFHALATPELGYGHLPAAAAARPDILLEDPRLSLSIVVPMGKPVRRHLQFVTRVSDAMS